MVLKEWCATGSQHRVVTISPERFKWRFARLTSRSTWSSMPAMSISPCLLSSTGKVVFQDIAKPSSSEWGTPLQAMEAALELEKTVNQSLLDLHKASDGKGDAHLCDFLEAEFLGEQVDGIKEIGDMITKIKRAGDGLG